jgi:hypothetical protein
MSDTKSTARSGSPLPAHAPGNAPLGLELEDPLRVLRSMGARAHQLRSSVTAADRFIARDATQDRDTGSWLISAATAMASELTADIDNLARSLRDRPADAAVLQIVSAVRVRAHQLSAATRAADHFLDQETREDRDTGSWLVATALGLAQKLAEEIEDGASSGRRAGADKGQIETHDAALARRVTAATATPLRGAA